jgi:hypothetical protein
MVQVVHSKIHAMMQEIASELSADIPQPYKSKSHLTLRCTIGVQRVNDLSTDKLHRNSNITNIIQVSFATQRRGEWHGALSVIRRCQDGRT